MLQAVVWKNYFAIHESCRAYLDDLHNLSRYRNPKSIYGDIMSSQAKKFMRNHFQNVTSWLKIKEGEFYTLLCPKHKFRFFSELENGCDEYDDCFAVYLTLDDVKQAYEENDGKLHIAHVRYYLDEIRLQNDWSQKKHRLVKRQGKKVEILI